MLKNKNFPRRPHVSCVTHIVTYIITTMALKSSHSPFPRRYFDGPTQSASEELVGWIYEEFSGWAYQGFLDQGRGLLIGPFLSGENEELIDTKEFLDRRGMGYKSDLSIVYVGINSPSFESTLPDLALRKRLIAAAQIRRASA